MALQFLYERTFRQMKKIFILLSIICFSFIVPFNINVKIEAASKIEINEINFPCETFRNYISRYFDKNNDNYLSNNEIKNVKKLCISNEHDDYPDLYSIEGIEYFTELATIILYNTDIEEADFRNNPKLIKIYITKGFSINSDNGGLLKNINISNNPKLKILDIDYNFISKVDLSNNIELENLSCGNNQISEINVSKNVKLKELFCSHNQLSEINISRNVKLKELDCTYNQISDINISNNPEIEVLHCSSNRLGNLTLGKNKKLYDLQCQRNKLNDLKIYKCNNLSILHCEKNNLHKLDISKNIKLSYLYCNANNITVLNTINNVKLRKLICTSNKIIKLNLSKNSRLSHYESDDNVKVVGYKYIPIYSID